MTANELNAVLVAALGMIVLAAAIVWNSETACRLLRARLGARAFYLENSRAEDRRWRLMAEERYEAEVASFQIRPADQVEGL